MTGQTLFLSRELRIGVFLFIRGEGGLGVKTEFSFMLPYVVALDILFPKWAHLPSNFARLPRYDLSK